MRSGNLWSVLGLCLIAAGVWGQEDSESSTQENSEGSTQEKYEVSISGTRVELTCPNQNPEWSFNANKLTGLGRTYVEEIFSEVEHSGFYSCDQNKTLLYLKARVCENCLEVDAMIVATIIIVDICITLGVLFVVYYWSKNKKAKAKPVTRVTGTGGRPRGPNKERPPPVPNPDYEPIRKGQRDLYAGLNHRGV